MGQFPLKEFRDELLTDEILKLLTLFWRVIAPEIFEMHVPRNLYPFILPDMKQDDCVSSSSPEQDPEENFTAEEINYVADEIESQVVADDPVIIFHNEAELEVENFFASSMTDTVAEPTSRSVNDLIVFPWGGITSNGITLVNTCPVDNWLMIFQAMVKSGKLNLEKLDQIGQVISNVLDLIDQKRYSDAKVEVLPDRLPIISNIMNFYAGEDELFCHLI